MPRSKRDKKISLTRTKKKGLEHKQKLIDQIRQSVDEYERIFIFCITNVRAMKLHQLRAKWRHSRFFIGKNRVMAVGLGRTKESELQPNIHKIAKRLIGQCGLLFTNKEEGEVVEWFENFHEAAYARSGNIATETVILPVGPLPFTHSLEPHLRQLGMPTCLERGVVKLFKEYTVCKINEPLTPEQARILELLEKPMAEFKVILKYMWSKDGMFKKYSFKDEDTSKKVKKEPTSVEEMEDEDKKDDASKNESSSDEEMEDEDKKDDLSKNESSDDEMEAEEVTVVDVKSESS